MAKPILKWAGGKRQILGEILSLFPKDYQERTFHEPMVGGGAVTFHIKPVRGTINDVNPRLTTFYKVVRDHPEALIEENKTHKNDETYYYEARAEFNKPIHRGNLSPIREASLLLFLNRTCFNGLYRENSKGEFNVPFGRYSNPDFVQAERIQKCSRILANLEILNRDFSYVLDKAEPGDLIYFDPPYQPVSETANFTEYSKEGFDFQAQQRLRDVCVQLDEKGVRMVLSNSWATIVRELYETIDAFTIHRVTAQREISSKVETRGDVYEMLVTNVAENQQQGETQKDLLSFDNNW